VTVTLAPVPMPDETAKRLKLAGRRQARWKQERDELIRLAHEQGAGPREIARLVGLSHAGVIRILRQQPPDDVEPTS
jgi:DNA invertase Pin-like site-specific DNA recombinase